MLSGRGVCDGLITHPEESYRLSYVVCHQETSSRRRKPWPALGCSAIGGGGILRFVENEDTRFQPVCNKNKII